MNDSSWEFLRSGPFWVASVAMGLLLNLLSAYVKEWLDHRWGVFKNSRSAKQTVARQKKAELAKRLVASPRALDLYQFRALVQVIALVTSTFISLIMTVLGMYTGVFRPADPARFGALPLVLLAVGGLFTYASMALLRSLYGAFEVIGIVEEVVRIMDAGEGPNG